MAHWLNTRRSLGRDGEKGARKREREIVMRRLLLTKMEAKTGLQRVVDRRMSGSAIVVQGERESDSEAQELEGGPWYHREVATLPWTPGTSYPLPYAFIIQVDATTVRWLNFGPLVVHTQ